ncbi:amino acid ABC transporter substrate-binding protein [Siccirubricoccus sp. KC 17139]|uniref:Amino acid ABC transporter substrate-binding protein n=1 Tax=Siccirubricoccus soli TaxID=2899147 RepID=A0ABT1D3Q0_9PROT|nr:amino acid ABC transporter substrate-binding protein [Siccirubricoccus soli]MCO6416558.1 amino acid ABC transporter substrate-binding protein [Siccirubricoccus soli]MCP2682693.1 amino acid ABC transporter substrate-binding protein [Siccirubricoccus soli]
MRFVIGVIALIGALCGPPRVAEAGSVLDAVKARGTLRCGTGGSVAGFSRVDSRGEWRGLDPDYCRALAAAVLGDSARVSFVALTLQNRFVALQSGEVDVLARDSIWSFTRDNSLGIVFAGVNFHTGTGVMVRRGSGIASMRDLDGATVCASIGGSNLPEVTDRVRSTGGQIRTLQFERWAESLDAFIAGRCDAVTAGAADLAATISVTVPNPRDYVVLPEIISRDPYGPAVARGDWDWLAVNRWLLFALVEAEERGITRANVREQARSSTDPAVRRLLGSDDNLGSMIGLPRDWAVRAIEAVGNYGEIYDRHFGPDTPIALDRGPNRVASQGGLHYSPPFR